MKNLFIPRTIQGSSSQLFYGCRVVLFSLLVFFLLLVGPTRAHRAEVLIPLTPQEQLFLKQHSRFLAHAETDYRPFVYVEDGQARGFAVDLTNLLAERLAIHIDYVVDESWDEAMAKLKQRQIDLVLAMVNTPKRRTFAHFTDPILTTYTGLATRKDDPGGKTLANFYGRRVATVDGYWHYDVLRQHYPQIVSVSYSDNVSCLEALATGEVDGVLSSNPVLAYQIRRSYMLGLETRPVLGSVHFRSNNEGYGTSLD